MIVTPYDDVAGGAVPLRGPAEAECAPSLRCSIAALRRRAIDGPTPRTFALAVKVAGRSDRHFIAETLRELGADVGSWSRRPARRASYRAVAVPTRRVPRGAAWHMACIRVRT